MTELKIKKIEDEIRQTKPFSNEYHKAAINLIFTGKWLIKLHNDLFQLYGVSLQQYNILRILNGIYPKSVTLNYIKKRMLDKMSDSSRVVETMNKNDLVIRTQNARDRRKVNVIITTKGIEILSKIGKKQAYLDKLLSPLDQTEILQLNYLLDKVRGK